jgi:hypothetical protein
LIGALLFYSPEGWTAEAILTKSPESTGKYCHLKFPAIREETLFTDRPVLKDPSSGDLVDIVAPCDYDPLGKEEVARQRAHRRHLRDQHYYSD